MLEVVADLQAKNSECPVWNPVDSKLYWSDIPNGRLYRFDPAVQSFELVLQSNQQIGGLVVCQDGGLLLLEEEGRIRKWNDGSVSVIRECLADEVGTRFNDAIADPKGRVLAGMMPAEKEPVRLYSFEPDGSYRILLEGVSLSNGMAFSPDGLTFWHTDTRKFKINSYRYNPETGEIGDLLSTIDFAGREGRPDGLTLDDTGRIWSAQWEGWKVLALQHGQIVDEIKMPVRRVSSVAFGGSELKDLYITTAGGDNRAETEPLAGSLFRIKEFAKGSPRHLAAF